MAITPEQLNELTREEEQRVKSIENEIDTALKERFVPDVRTEVCIELPKGVFYRDRVYHKIVGIYKEAGWNIEYEPGRGRTDLPGEGGIGRGTLIDYMIFTPRRKTKNDKRQ